jgi:hypothetical protein
MPLSLSAISTLSLVAEPKLTGLVGLANGRQMMLEGGRLQPSRLGSLER